LTDWNPDIERLQAFEDEEWMRVEREYCGRLLAYVGRRIHDVQAREDVLQETLLGAVRGIGGFDPTYTFEQYLFGICHNRTIDHLRRRRLQTLEIEEDGDGMPGIESMAAVDETPSRIVRGADLAARARRLLGELLKDWVQETWAQGEFVRLMVIEALFCGGWRNKDTWERFELRDETAVAGIKFRAIKRLRELAREKDPRGELLPALATATETGETTLDFDVSEIWRQQRVSCPARHWIARQVTGNLDEGPRKFLEFHLNEMECPWCQANLEDLSRVQQKASLEPMIERVHASTLQYLRSRTLR
jgi:RNA polymerase sigma factor (sigma-70 family)